MVVVEILLIAVVVFGVAAVAMGFGGSMTHFAPDWPGRTLPAERAVHDADIATTKFSLAFRGYRMAEVDVALDRLAHEIAGRDAAIEKLTGRTYEWPEPVTPPVEVPSFEKAPAQTAPTEFVPVEFVPVEFAPAEALPAEAIPVERAPVDPTSDDKPHPEAG